ncbi:MAG: NADH-quinone oxidoreductase subunit I [Acidobacteria bacterium]|nr:NADH-quinone oxidoreductase subunit I [Acidobacteriota bacterium]
MLDFLRRLFFIDILKGLLITVSYMLRRTYTEQYPTQRPHIADRYRGAPRLNKDPETGETLCISCDLCALACPEDLIVVTSERDPETRRKILREFTFDLSRCLFCGLCQEACPVNCIELTQYFELSAYDKDGAKWNKDMLENGPTSVPGYSPTLQAVK